MRSNTLPAESDNRLIRRQLELARADLVPGQLHADPLAARICVLLRRQSESRVPHRLGSFVHSWTKSQQNSRGGSRTSSCAIQPTAVGGPSGAITSIFRPIPTGATTCRSSSTSTATRARASARAIKPVGRHSWFRCSTNTGNKMRALNTAAGRSSPIGATVGDGGVNFCVYAKHADAIELLLFDSAGDAKPRANRYPRSAAKPHLRLLARFSSPASEAGQLYGYRVSGPNDPAAGLRFDPQKLLVDPYALAVANTENYQRSKAAALRRQHGRRHEECGGRSVAIRLGRRHADRAAIPRHGHLRNARRRVHAESQFRCRSPPNAERTPA